MSDDVSSCVLLLRIIILAADLTDDGRLMTCDVDELSSKCPRGRMNGNHESQGE